MTVVDLRDREMPHNYDAEQALLGAVLANNQVYLAVDGFLRPEHFNDPLHGRIYEACGKLVGDGQIANPVTLKNLFDQDGALTEIGGAQYLVELAASVVTVINAEDYGRAVHDLYLRRQTIQACMAASADAYAVGVERAAADVIHDHETALLVLSENASGQKPVETAGSAAIAAIEMAERAADGDGVAGLRTGLGDLDRLMGGLHPGLIVLAARPSMGKTTLAVNIADRAGRQAATEGTGGVLLCSREMASPEIGMKLLAARTGISTDEQLSGHVSGEQVMMLRSAADELSRLPIVVDDRSDSVPAIASRARRLHRRNGLSLLVIDYLHLLRTTERRIENRNLEIGHLTRSLKLLAQELEVPVLVLSQLSRDVERRDDKRPVLPDLRDSGSIEQDADAVIFLYREEYYLEQAEPKRGTESAEKFSDVLADWNTRLDRCRNVAEIVLAKNRMGRRGVVRAHFNGAAGRFSDLAVR